MLIWRSVQTVAETRVRLIEICRIEIVWTLIEFEIRRKKVLPK